MQSARSRALAALFASVLAACGGGGGDGDAGNPGPGGSASAGGSPPAASGPVAGGAPAPAPAPGAPAPAPAAFSAFGPTVIAESTTGPSPAVARLTTGGSAAAYAAERDQLLVRRFAAAGAAVGDALVVHGTAGQNVGAFAMAPTSDGGFVVFWAVEATANQSVLSLRARRYGADGSLQWDSRVSDTLFNSISDLAVRQAANGDILLGWSGTLARSGMSSVFVQRLSAAGAPQGAAVNPQGPFGDRDQVSLVPLPDGTLVIVWRQRDDSARTYSAYFQRFGSDLQPSAAPLQVRGSAGGQAIAVGAAARADGNVAIGWGTQTGTGESMVHLVVITPAGDTTVPVFSTSSTWPVTDVEVVPLAEQGFALVWQDERAGPRETTATLWMQRFDATGAPAGSPQQLDARIVQWVSPVTGAFGAVNPGFDADGGADGHLVGTFHRAAEGDRGNTLLFGR